MMLKKRRQFEDDLDRLRDAKRKVFDKCCGVMRDIETGRVPLAKLRSEDRLARGKKYDLGDGYRAVFQEDGTTDALVALRVGKHEDMDRFLEEHRGRQVAAPVRPGSAGSQARVPSNSDRYRGHPLAPTVDQKDHTAANRSVTRDGPKPVPLFDNVNDGVFKDLGISQQTIASLRLVDDVDSRSFQDLLIELETANPDVANRIFEYATDKHPNDSRALLALTSRTALQGPSRDPESAPSLAPALASVNPASSVVGTGTGPGRVPSARGRRAAKKKQRTTASGPRSRTGKKTVSKTLRPAVKVAVRKTIRDDTRRRGGAAGERKDLLGGLKRQTREESKPIRTFGALKKLLVQHGFNPLDNRPFGGGIWVLSDQRGFASAKRDLERRSIACKFHPAGTRKRERDASWQIDIGKRIPKR